MEVRVGPKEGWMPKNWCFQTVMLERNLESPLDSKEIKPINPKGDQHGIFIGRTDAEVEAPIFWQPAVRSQLTGKDPGIGKDWGREEKVATEDEMVGWHHILNGHEFEQTLGSGTGQGSLMCCSPCGHKESDTTDWTIRTITLLVELQIVAATVKSYMEVRPEIKSKLQYG